MRKQISLRVLAVAAATVTMISGELSLAGKPTPTPAPTPPPLIGGNACVNSSGEFPAMAHIKRKLDRKGLIIGNDLYLANSDNSCSILVYSTTSKALEPKYKQVGSEGRIVFADVPARAIKLIRFSVVDRAIVNSIPLQASSVFARPGVAIGLFDQVISADLNRLYFTTEVDDVTGRGHDQILSADISSCSSNCPTSVELDLASDSNAAAMAIAVSSGEDRMVIGYNSFVGSREVLVSSKDISGNWSPLRKVISGDALYSNVNQFYSLDLNGGLLALSYQPSGVNGYRSDVLDISSCSSVGSSSCLSSGEAVVVQKDLPGVNSNFSSESSLLCSVDQTMYSVDIISRALSALGTGEAPNSSR